MGELKKGDLCIVKSEGCDGPAQCGVGAPVTVIAVSPIPRCACGRTFWEFSPPVQAPAWFTGDRNVRFGCESYLRPIRGEPVGQKTIDFEHLVV